MKTLLMLVSFVCIGVGFYSCNSYTPISKEKPENNQTYEVEYLFEHDGCKMYRFRDGDRYVYFTNCTGNVTALKGDSAKSRVQTTIKANY